MEREMDFERVTDGKFYDLNDMVKADCNGCEGCSACCHGMEDTIVLDPWDIWQLTSYLNMPFYQLVDRSVELGIVDGIILPHLLMHKDTSACAFLDEYTCRCRIHPARPGICRIFPLGRLYVEESRSYKYFLQVNECIYPGRSKTKLKKWVDTPELKKKQQFIIDWHFYLKDLQKKIEESGNVSVQRNIGMQVMKDFYAERYTDDRDFYEQFYERLERAKNTAVC